jgi:hypothetical protein
MANVEGKNRGPVYHEQPPTPECPGNVEWLRADSFNL